MTITLNEYRHKWSPHHYEMLYKTHTVEGANEKSCFEKIYTGFIRPSRYCGDVFFRLDDEDLDKRFHVWQRDGVTFEMYYGNGTVD